MTNQSTTSRPGRAHHLCRQDVLTYYLDAQLRETPATLEDFAIAFAQTYAARVPEHARSLEITVPDEKAMAPREFMRVLDRVRKRVQRWKNGENALPAEAEEAWAYALMPDYGERCRHELAWRYGFIGAVSHAVAPCPDTEIIGRLLGETGRATAALARALVNGAIEPADIADGEIEADLLDLEATVASVRARVQCVRDRLRAPGGVVNFHERRARVRPAKDVR